MSKKIELSPYGKKRSALFPTCVRFHFKIELSVDVFVYEDGNFLLGSLKSCLWWRKLNISSGRQRYVCFFKKKIKIREMNDFALFRRFHSFFVH